jgi:hypothetical protein
MKWTAEVVETSVVHVRYAITADTEDEAMCMASNGDYEKREVTIPQRTVHHELVACDECSSCGDDDGKCGCPSCEYWPNCDANRETIAEDGCEGCRGKCGCAICKGCDTYPCSCY